MQRWIARLLVLVMVVPAFGSLSMTQAAPAQTPHCARHTAGPVMQCHHGMSMAPQPASSSTSFGATDSCCQNHDCCCGMAVPQWAQAPSQLLSLQGLPAVEGFLLPGAQLTSFPLADRDSARAPPRRPTLQT